MLRWPRVAPSSNRMFTAPQHVTVRAGCALISIVCFCFIAFAQSSDGTELNVEIVPATLSLAPMQNDRVALVVTNGTSSRIEITKVEWIASGGVKIAVPHVLLEKPVLDAGSMFRWMVEMTQSDPAADVRKIDFFLDYNSPQEVRSEKDISGTARATIELKSRSAITTDSVIGVRVESAIKTLEEPRSGTILLVVNNKSNSDVSITNIDVTAPSDIDTSWTKDPRNALLSPQQEDVFPLEVKSKNGVQTGKHVPRDEYCREIKSGRSRTKFQQSGKI